jgi:hypothetical protein
MSEEQGNNSPWSVATILTCINDCDHLDNGKWPNLESMLNDIEWDEVASDLIEPKNVRNFAKKIEKEEVRLDVLKYLSRYAKQYFLDAAEQKEYNEKLDASVGIQLVIPNIKSASENLQVFQQELLFLIDQIEKKGEFTGDKFAKQAKRITELEKQVNELKKENENLSVQLYKYKHPHANGKYIPEKLDRTEFYNIMNHLANHKIVRVVTEPDEMGIRKIICYQWDASKILFGYFVTKVNDALELRGARVPYDWKVFEPAINNYSELIKEARKAFSTYNNSSSLQQNRIKNAEFVDEAIKYKVLPF